MSSCCWWEPDHIEFVVYYTSVAFPWQEGEGPSGGTEERKDTELTTYERSFGNSLERSEGWMGQAQGLTAVAVIPERVRQTAAVVKRGACLRQNLQDFLTGWIEV